jgi:hydroxymethylbilane synthase
MRLAGGCTVPIAAHAVEDGARIRLRAAVGGPDGRGGVKLLRAQALGIHPIELGAIVAEELLERGAAQLLEAARGQASGLPAPKKNASPSPA